MSLQIIDSSFTVTLYGFSGKVLNKDYAGTGMQLMNAMWNEIKTKEIKNKGINYWVYEKGELLFTGVELEEDIPDDSRMELKKITLARYAYWKHVGPYTKLKEAYSNMHSELEKRNIGFYFPFLEIYGHWTPDENKLETEILFSLAR